VLCAKCHPKITPKGDFIMTKNIKKRNWAFVAYPESLPKDWLEILQKSGLQCAISPLHDKDTNPDEKEKKPHYHVIVCYSGPTSYNVVARLTESLHSTIPQALEQVKGYYRYLTHKDNPEKHQYNEKDIITINGFNILDHIEITKSEVLKHKRNLLTLIIQYELTEYSTFCKYILENGTEEEFDIATSHTIFFNNYLTSARHKLLMQEKEKSKS